MRYCVGANTVLFSIILLWSILYPGNGLRAAIEDWTHLSLEELMGLEVTSVSKKTQQLSDSAAAIFVLTGEDIRRSGVTTIPEALRMVPGLVVTRIDSNKWAINARGLNSRFSSHLLVMIDGRSVYSPAFSGVYWEANDVILEDLDRIEVIRGPGAALWGANAVNGVINIITKSAAETQGGLVAAGGGSPDTSITSARYGGKLGDRTYWRVYAKQKDHDSFSYPDGGDAGDNWHMEQAGFRMDSTPTDADRITLQGDVYDGDISQTLYLAQLSPPFSVETDMDTTISGRNLLARWQRTLSSTSDFAVQAYYDATERSEDIITDDRYNLDLDFQHRFALGTRQDILWGGRYRYTSDDYVNSIVSDFYPLSRQTQLFSAFFQDEISLVPDHLWLTLGSKFEHNDYSGEEVQPSARLMWAVSHSNRLWTAVSRAVRTPSRVEADGTITYRAIRPIPFLPPVVITVSGNEDFQSEELTAYEMGYRFIPNKSYTFDLALFFNEYEGLRNFKEQAPEFNGSYIERNLLMANRTHGETYGLELRFTHFISGNFKWDLSYWFLEHDFQDGDIGGFPRHQARIRGQFNLGKKWELDIGLRYVDAVSTPYLLSDSLLYESEEYLTMDIRLGWHITPKLALSLVGRNLFDTGHVENVQEAFTRATEIERSLFAKLTYRF